MLFFPLFTTFSPSAWSLEALGTSGDLEVEFYGHVTVFPCWGRKAVWGWQQAGAGESP